MSKAWQFFVKETSDEAKCKKCFKKISTKGGSTKGLLTHLRTIHQIDLRALSETYSQHDLSEEPECKKRKLPVITEYFSVSKPSLDEILARMTAKDGLSFKIFITSKDLRAGLAARGLDVPLSAVTIRQIVMDYASKIEQQIVEDLYRRRQQGERFSLTVDEWTGINNKRYANINVHMSDRTVHHLGLTRIKGSMTAELCKEMVVQRTSKFGLDIETDVICCTTDAASVMVKFGKLMNCEHQLCYAHGVHLAVCDVLYINKSSSVLVLEPEQSEKNHPNDDWESADDSEDDGFDVCSEVDVTNEFSLGSLNSIIQKVRCIVKLIRRSPVKNDLLQRFAKEDLGKELCLVLDVKTRWNSLIAMLERFLEMKEPLRKALTCLGLDIPLTNDDFQKLHEISTALKPLELVGKTLSGQSCTLVMAETAVNFAIKELQSQNSALGSQLELSLKKRMKERQSLLASAAICLSNGGNMDSVSEINMMKTTLIKLAQRLNVTVAGTDTDSSPSIVSLDAPPSTIPSSMVDRLRIALEKSTENHVVHQKMSSARVNLMEITIRRELEFLRTVGQRGKVLETLHMALMSVPPTSVDAERAFSAGGSFLTKIRSRLGDDTLSKLCLLKAYFNKFN